MTDEARKIIAALRGECGDQACGKCPSWEWCHGDRQGKLDDDIADLIEKLSAEVEEAEKKGMEIAEQLVDNAVAFSREYDKFKAERDALSADLEAAKECEKGLSIMLTSAQSAAETYKRERDAAVADINMCCPCEVCTRSCTYDKVNPYDECADFEWRGVKNDA